MQHARANSVSLPTGVSTDYDNTDSSIRRGPNGNLDLKRHIRSAIRWNSIMMVLRASKKDLDLGGHMSSFQSSATIYEVLF